jgi:hypothetical protein
VEVHNDNRSEGRSNVFLAAALETAAGSIPVRIRNISSEGALLDGPSFPPLDTRVTLARGGLSAAGKIVWQEEGYCGISFDERIAIVEWVKRVGHSGQQRVDGIVAAIRKSGTVPEELQAVENSDESLPAISEALEQLCERLASSPNMSMELGEELLKLDCIAHSLRTIADGVADRGSLRRVSGA